jgi:type I restriction enzyme M protein
VDHDYIEGVVLLPENLFYNTSAAGVIVVINKRKPASRKGSVILVNASGRATKGRPKNHLEDTDVRALAALYASGVPVEGEVAVASTADLVSADYNLSPARWVSRSADRDHRAVKEIVADLVELDERAAQIDLALMKMLESL